VNRFLSLHPSINVEHEAKQGASFVFPVFGMTQSGFEPSQPTTFGGACSTNFGVEIVQSRLVDVFIFLLIPLCNPFECRKFCWTSWSYQKIKQVEALYAEI